MFGKIKSIITGKKTSKSKPQEEKSSILLDFKDGSGKVFGYIKDYFVDLFFEIKVMKEKSKDLLKTNVNLGLKHLNNDKISDAIFRFKIISIFWPSHVKTYYYLAHCYILKQKYEKADVAIRKLLEMDPSYEAKVGHMINKINQAKSG